VQKDLLANQATITYLAEIEGRTPEQRRQMLQSITPARREILESGINRWGSISDGQRRKMLERFKGFFDLSAQEKQKALNTLSAPERRQIEQTLRTFGSLPPDQRSQVIRSFGKFAGLSLAERQQFLKSAERWKLLSPAERQAWREVVRRLPPPEPPDLPPLPSAPHATRSAPTVATNRN
jgi:DNA-binding MarR family transcriptional regulator